MTMTLHEGRLIEEAVAVNWLWQHPSERERMQQLLSRGQVIVFPVFPNRATIFPDHYEARVDGSPVPLTTEEFVALDSMATCGSARKEIAYVEMPSGRPKMIVYRV